MKIWLDDIRKPPKGWVHVFWPQEVFPLLEKGLVSEISLDHDLGNDRKGTGYDVLTYLEELILTKRSNLPIIYIHTMNPVARMRMNSLVNKLEQIIDNY